MEKKLYSALKELALYLGGKIDDLKRTFSEDFESVKVAITESKTAMAPDLTIRAIQKLQDSNNANVNQVVKALESLSKQDSGRLQELTRVIASLQRAIETDKGDTSVLQGMLSQLEALAKAQRRPDEKPAKSSEATEFKAALQGIVAAVRESKPAESKPIDLSPVTTMLRELKTAVIDLAGAVNRTSSLEAIRELQGTMRSLRLEVPKTVKIDDTQFRALSNVGGGAIAGGALGARSASVTNVAMTSANTQYTHIFPANTVAFELRVRSTDVPLLVAYETGKLPTSGDGSAYFTVPAYFVEKTPGLDWSGKTIYVQTASADQVLEVINYTA